MTSDALISSNVEQPDARRGGRLAWWLRPKVAFPLLLITVVLLAPVIIRGYRLSLIPETPEPFDTQAVLNVVVPDEQNAFVELRQAAGLFVELSHEDSLLLDKALEGDWEDVPDVIRRWGDDNSRVIELWQLAAAKPDAQYIRASEADIFTQLPVVQKLRRMAQLVKLDAMRFRAEGHPEQAWDLMRSGVQVGYHTGRRGCLLEHVVGAAVIATISEEIANWAQDPTVTTDMLSRANRELNDMWAGRPRVSSMLQREYLMAKGAIRTQYVIEEYLSYHHSSLPSIQGVGSVSWYTLGEPNLSDRALNHAFRNYLTQVDKPARERTKQLNPGGCFELEPGLPSSTPTASQVNTWISQAIGARLVVPSMPHVIFALNKAEVRNSLLKTVLALEVYRRQHGDYPEALSALVPEFMREIPDDIFEPSPSPLKYRHDGSGVLLWSVGQDGTDNGGIVEHDKDMGYFLGPELSKADRQDEAAGPSQ